MVAFFYASGPFVKVRVRLIDGCWSLLPSCSSLEIRSARLLFVVNPSIGHEIRDIDKWPEKKKNRGLLRLLMLLLERKTLLSHYAPMIFLV